MTSVTGNELVVRPKSDVAEPLDALAQTVRDEHGLVLDSAASALDHARAAGVALNQARTMFTTEGWVEWLLKTFDFKLASAYRYMRVAKNWDLIVEHGYATFTDAIVGLRQTQMGTSRERITKYRRETFRQIRELHDSGMSERAIAEVAEVSRTTVWRTLNPEKAKERIRNDSRVARERRKAWQRERRAQLAKTAGGDIGAAYSRVRELAEIIDRAAANEGDIDARGALNSALLRLYKVEDMVVQALGTHKDSGSS